MKRDEKFALADRYKEMLEDIAGFVLLDYRGLTVAEITELRGKLRGVNSRLQVVRNRILGHAMREKPYGESISRHLADPTAIAVASEDAIVVAKVLNEFKKNHDVVELKAGVVETEYLDTEQVQGMHKMRSKKELLAAILGGIQAPASNILGGVQGLSRKLASLMRAYEKKLEEAA